MKGQARYHLSVATRANGGPGSSVSIVTAYGLDGPGIKSQWGARFSTPAQTGPEAHPASCTMGTRSFPGVRCHRGVMLTPHPLLVPRSKIEYSYTSTLPKGLCGLWKGETYLQGQRGCHLNGAARRGNLLWKHQYKGRRLPLTVGTMAGKVSFKHSCKGFKKMLC